MVGPKVYCSNCGEKWGILYVLRRRPELFKIENSRMVECPHCKFKREELSVLERYRVESRNKLFRVYEEDVELLINSYRIAGKIITVCCKCKKIKNERGEYISFEEFVKEKGFVYDSRVDVEERLETLFDLNSSHTYCSDCMASYKRELEESRKKREGLF